MTRPAPLRILTVCLGNHCRSPLAAAVLAHHGGPTLEVRSAGIRDKWAGHPAHPAMVAAAAAHGYDLGPHRGAPITEELLAWADVVLAMDGNNLAALRNLAAEHTAAKLGLYLGDRDVPDPWGKGEDAFAAVVRMIEGGAGRHLP